MAELVPFAEMAERAIRRKVRTDMGTLQAAMYKALWRAGRETNHFRFPWWALPIDRSRPQALFREGGQAGLPWRGYEP